MTWFANNIYAPYSTEVLSEFRKTFPGFIYHVTTLSNHQWFREEITHDLPLGGLLVVRPVGTFGEFASNWYNDVWLDWGNIHYGKGSALTFNRTLLDADEEELNQHPPDRFLAYLKKVSEEYATQLFYYSCFMWGGDVESEYSFLYDNGDEQVFLFTGIQHEQSLASRYSNKDIQHGQTLDVLQESLQKIGLRIPTAYFALHTRGFPWNKYHIDSEEDALS